MVNKYMLTPRLKCITEYVKCKTVADIGTDHAYIPIELVENGKAERAIAADVREGPLKIASSNIEKHGLADKIEVRLGDGLSVLTPGEADIIIIAGMGGILIKDIIEAHTEIAKSSVLVLQPMNSQYELRKWLISNGFTVLNEDIECEEHHVYNIMVVSDGVQDKFERDIDYHIPPMLYKNKNFRALFEKKKREFSKIIKGLEKAENADNDKLEYYRRSYKELKELEKYVD